MANNWTPLRESNGAQLLEHLSKFAAAVFRLQLTKKLEEGKQMVALIQQNYGIKDGRHEQNSGRPEKLEQ